MSFIGTVFGRGKRGPRRPSGFDPYGRHLIGKNLERHVHVDVENQTLFLDEDRRSSDEMQEWLNAHRRLTGAVWPAKWEGIAELTARKASFREITAIRDQAGEGAATAREAGRKLLTIAAAFRISDMHFRHGATHTSIEIRLRKKIMILKEVSRHEGRQLEIAIFNLQSSRKNTYSEKDPQDGGITGDALPGTGLANVRIIRGPSYPQMDGGGFMSLRFQYKEGTGARPEIPPDIILRSPKKPEVDIEAELLPKGFSQRQIDLLKYLCSFPAGFVVLTGPTGSGKSTTLLALSRHQARIDPHKRLITIERPVEYFMPWAVQLEVSNTDDTEQAQREFAEHARNMLRMDPDRVVIGEIQDVGVALVAVTLARTGHSGLTTLHVDDAFDIFPRLEDMDNDRLKRQVICDTSLFRGVVAQRIQSVLCPHCKLPWEPDDPRMPSVSRDALRSWGDTSGVYRRNPDGCDHCNHMGNDSPTAVAEVVVANTELMSNVIRYGVEIARQWHRARPDADSTMVEKSIALAFEGRVDPADIIGEVGQIPFRQDLEQERHRAAATRAARDAGVEEAAP